METLKINSRCLVANCNVASNAAQIWISVCGGEEAPVGDCTWKHATAADIYGAL